MHVIAMDDGAPGEHRGVAHMLKHYLAPSELWQDLVEQSASEHPWRVIDAIGVVEPAAWEQWQRPGERVRALWSSRLVAAYRDGYLAVIRRVLAPLRIDPAWRLLPGRKWATSTSDGLLIIIQEEQRGFALRTAFRVLEFTRREYRSVPMTPDELRMRSLVAQQKAKRRLLEIAQRGHDD